MIFCVFFFFNLYRIVIYIANRLSIAFRVVDTIDVFGELLCSYFTVLLSILINKSYPITSAINSILRAITYFQLLQGLDHAVISMLIVDAARPFYQPNCSILSLLFYVYKASLWEIKISYVCCAQT